MGIPAHHVCVDRTAAQREACANRAKVSERGEPRSAQPALEHLGLGVGLGLGLGLGARSRGRGRARARVWVRDGVRVRVWAVLEHLRRERLAVAAVAAVPIFKQRGERLGDRGRPCVVKARGRRGSRASRVGAAGRSEAEHLAPGGQTRRATRIVLVCGLHGGGRAQGPRVRRRMLGVRACRGSPSISRKEVVSPPERREPTMGTLSSH